MVIVSDLESKLLPFIVNFLAGYIGKSYSITTNNEEECYVISREEFLELTVVMLNESSVYTQKIYSIFREHYITNYIHALYARVVSASSLQFLKKHFTLLLKDFHKLVEGRLAEQNFSVIYELDKLAKFIKYSLYDGTLIFDKLKEESNRTYLLEMNAVELESKDIVSRKREFVHHVDSTLQEFIRFTHNDTMSKLR